MTSAALTIALFATEQLIKESPALFLKFQQMVIDKNITAAQLQQKRAELASQKFEHLVPNSQLPPDIG
jgi:hypothetical protein